MKTILYNSHDLAYLAGLLDGEGYVGIGARVSGKYKSRQLILQVRIGMTDSTVIQWVHKTFGGQIYEHKRLPNKTMWLWSITQQPAADLLAVINPYLKTKRTQAWLAQEYQAQRTPSTGGKLVPVEELVLREGFMLAIRNVNA
ncbi:hypothetical protein LCGC14_0938960 [marine sediment metagenome]|uniref:Homing endonuclease LAGLIDADG domain-containing protein n=1 Tax=marine sediment metagenome TaxID=412755 RepID=A0A0F9RS09_9ZZZZ